MKRLDELYPFLFAVFPILAVAAENRAHLVFAHLVSALLVSLAFTALALWASRRLLGDRRRAALVTTLGLIAFFAYGHVFESVEGTWDLFGGLWGLQLSWQAVVAALWLALFGTVLWLVIRGAPGRFETLSSLLAATGVAAMGLLGVRVGWALWQGPDAIEMVDPAALERFREHWRQLPALTAPEGDLPNVYHLVLDGYASAQVLDTVFGHDNGGFERRLSERGFYIAGESRSNYPITFLSLASSLNMVLLDDLAAAVGPWGTSRRPAHDVIDDHRIQRAFEDLGYRTIHLSSGWGPTRHNPAADEDLRCGWESELVTVLANTTLLRPLSNGFFSRQVRERIECTFETLAELHRRSEQPFFVFAHLITPHPPYLFGPAGEARPAKAHDLVVWRPRSGYADQVKYVNRRLEAVIDQILSNERPSIVIVHGDHGSATSGATDGDIGDLTEPTPLVSERTGIFHALYLPEPCRERLYPSITPVNSFRLLLSCHYGADLPLLDDKVYFSGYARPYLLRDVTALFGSPAEDVQRPQP